MMRFLFSRHACGESLAEALLCGLLLFIVLPIALTILAAGFGLVAWS